MRTTFLASLIGSLIVTSLLASGVAHADFAAFELDRDDAPAGRTELGFDGGVPLVGWGASIGLGYVARPLVLHKGIYEVAPVARRMTIFPGGAIALGERIVLDGRLPMARQIGRGLIDFGQPSLDRWVVGDLRLAARVRVAGTARQAMFVRVAASLPTGDDAAFAGEAGVVGGVALIGRFTADNGVVLAATAGLRLRFVETQVGDQTAGNELVGGLGVVAPLPRDLHASAELVGALGDKIGGVRGPSPVEGRIGIGVVAYRGMELGFRLGTGFVDEAGSPRWRASFEVAWSGDWQLAKHLPIGGESGTTAADDDGDD
ncbi:MAG: hypothetical protein NT062_00010 [Proteobacteria bacterium]|nr:hypothetical protein [Pseudomonadota bacterium]